MSTFPIKQKMMNWALLIIAFLLFGPAGACLAGKQEKPLPAHYPEEFSFVNCIERVDAGEILMGDSLYKLAYKVRYYVPESIEPTSRSRFRPGRAVGVVLNARDEIESMWYLGLCR
jgi:hypothetical protein